MSLNRCLSFTSKTWNSVLFEGCNVFGVIILSAIASMMGAVGIIKTSEVTRLYFYNFGFLDVGPENTGFKVTINRSFNLFPIGSVICYIVLYRYFYKRNRKVVTKTIFMKRGEQQVFSQLLVTAFLYLILNIIYEAITLMTWNADDPLLLLCLEALAIANYLPEMTLPLSVTVGSVQFKKLFRKVVASKEGKEVAQITKSI
ncbi:unnamed protein product [Caenorhabditis brenneri]